MAIKSIAETPTPTPKLAQFRFSTETASVVHNTQLLQNADNNFTKNINEHQDTSLSYSTEFRSLEFLSSICKNHNTFPFCANLHQHGMNYAFKRTLSNDESMAKLNVNIARGNHRLATKRPEVLEEKLEREEIRIFCPGVSLVILQHSGHNGTYLWPCNSTRTRGYQIDSLTTYPSPSQERTLQLTAGAVWMHTQNFFYGFYISRIIHFIVALKERFPNNKILISKWSRP